MIKDKIIEYYKLLKIKRIDTLLIQIGILGVVV